jgi:SagB-type dehydrogenase family enzyme
VFALDYHDATKHHFHRFARSLGYLDWATQPDGFRRYAGAPLIELPRTPVARDTPYEALFTRQGAPEAFSEASIAELLRCSLGLSAWKQYQRSRWSLRVNPSSGNLHPTEAYLVRDGRVCHYAPREHALEARCRLDPCAWRAFTGGRDGLLVALTTIHWREAWKYGERAFRYCQHDAGHALGALRLAAAMLGWTLAILPRWSDEQIGALCGVDRAGDLDGAEPEVPELVAVVTGGDAEPWRAADPAPLAASARAASWQGRANRLSLSTVDWPIIDAVASATRYEGSGLQAPGSGLQPPISALRAPGSGPGAPGSRLRAPGPARAIILRRRSAVAFDRRSSISGRVFLSMLARLQPVAPPWDAIDWPPQVHLMLFVHRVDGLTPGVYAYLRDASVLQEWRSAMRPEFLWEAVSNEGAPAPPSGAAPAGERDGDPRLFLLLPCDVTWPANRVSCDQDIAADGFFSLGMIARVEASLHERGESFYRRLFWECGLIGQVLYLEAEAAGARATGIGCFYDDAVHELAGLSGRAWQSLYHFSMGVPVEDGRLTTEPGYPWESG